MPLIIAPHIIGELEYIRIYEYKIRKKGKIFKGVTLDFRILKWELFINVMPDTYTPNTQIHSTDTHIHRLTLTLTIMVTTTGYKNRKEKKKENTSKA